MTAVLWGLGWLVVALALALVIGRVVRTADEREGTR